MTFLLIIACISLLVFIFVLLLAVGRQFKNQSILEKRLANHARSLNFIRAYVKENMWQEMKRAYRRKYPR